MKEETISITQTFRSPSEAQRQALLQQKTEHYLKLLLESSKPR